MINPEPVRYSIPRYYVWLILGAVVIVTGAGTVGLLIATAVGTNPPPIPFTAAFVLVSGILWYCILKLFAIEIIVWPSDGRVVFHYLARERESRLADIESISMGAGRSNAVIVRYRGGSAIVFMYLDWREFIGRVREQNPQVDVKGF